MSTNPDLRDVRCTGTFVFKDTGTQSTCTMLLAQVSIDFTGTLSLRCRRCGKYTTIRIGPAVNKPAATIA